MVNPANPRKPFPVGYCDAKLIRRNRMRSFYCDLEQPTRETSMLAFDLFDRYGRLKKIFKEHTVQKGSGIWGDEFDSGDLFLIESISIQEAYRHQELGRKLVTSLLDKVRSKSYNFYAVVAPGWLNEAVSAETKGATETEVEKVQLRHQAISEAFFRSMGFRRVGASKWLAMASNPEHPCHSLEPAADFELPTPPQRSVSSETWNVLEDCLTMGDQVLLVQLQTLLKEKSRDDPAWQITNNSGNTMLHYVALTSKPQTISWLLEKNPTLRDIRNDRGETAIDALHRFYDDLRTKRDHGMLTLSVSDQFTGFTDNTVACIVALKGISAATNIEKLCFKYGCTCHRCVGGFLSPRMRFTLRNTAEFIHDMLNMSGDMDLMFDDFDEMHAQYLHYVPQSVRQNMKTNKSMRQGFAKLFSRFAAITRQDNARGLPTEANIRLHLDTESEWPPHSKNYLSRGGTIYAIGSCIFRIAMDEDEVAGDGDPMMLDEDEKEEKRNSSLGLEQASLPECRNDLEYGFVSARLGYKMVSREYYHQD
jgi:hypothetical protein